MRYLVSGMLVVGIIHLLPLSGALGSERLASLYGVSLSGPNLIILMRHRAVLFGLLSTFLLVAAFRRSWQIAAFVAGFVSVVSFLWLASSVAGYNAEVGRVFMADIVALICLVVGVGAHAYAQRARSGVIVDKRP